MFAYVWPLFLVVASNSLYQICSKSIPADANPFLSVAVTYGVAMVASLVVFFVRGSELSIGGEAAKLNWASALLGVVVIGLELGFLMMYRAGWEVSVGQFVASAIVAVVLVGVGALVYKEPITLSKVAGIVICLAGLWVMNK